MKTPCPTGCGRMVDTLRFVMCGTCWRDVPDRLQADVWRTWRLRRLNPTPENVRAHENAKEAAIGHVA